MKLKRVTPPQAKLGLDVGVFSVKGVLIENSRVTRIKVQTAGRPLEAARKCITELLDGKSRKPVTFGVMGQNSGLIADNLGITPLLEIETLREGLENEKVEAD